MKHRLKNRKGFSLVEVIVATVISGIITYALYTVLIRSQSDSQTNIVRSQMDGLELAQFLLGMGRLADSCERPCSRASLPANTTCELQCQFRYADGSTAQLTVLNDTVTGATYIEDSKIPGTWVRRSTYPASSIKSLEICGLDEMVAVPSTCPIQTVTGTQDKLETQYAAGTPNARFYRFRIRLPSTIKKTANTLSADRFISSAFYVRNPYDVVDPKWPVPRMTKEK